MNEKEVHEKIVSFIDDDLARFAADTQSGYSRFYCLVLENGEIGEKLCESEYDASLGAYVEIDASSICDQAAEEAAAEGIDPEYAENEAICNIVADWINSGQAARDLISKLEESELREIK